MDYFLGQDNPLWYFSYFQEITNVNYSGLELASTTSKYRKLVVPFLMSYEPGAYYCSGKLVGISFGKLY